jgi:hypothetical protein
MMPTVMATICSYSVSNTDDTEHLTSNSLEWITRVRTTYSSFFVSVDIDIPDSLVYVVHGFVRLLRRTVVVVQQATI